MIYNTLLAEISIIFSVVVLLVSEARCLKYESKVIKILILCRFTNILFQCHLFLPSFPRNCFLFFCSVHIYYRQTELSIELRLMLSVS
jgi:hypothetical protein